MISRACATARYGHCSMPVRVRERSVSLLETAISTAPPPGSRYGSSSTLRHTCMASCRFLSTSWKSQTALWAEQINRNSINCSAGQKAHRQDLLASPSQQDGTRFGVFALSDEGEILVSYLFHFKQPRPHTDVFLTQFVCPTDNTSPTSPDRKREKDSRRVPASVVCWRLTTVWEIKVPGNAVVVGLPHTTNGGDVCLHQVVLGQIWQKNTIWKWVPWFYWRPFQDVLPLNWNTVVMSIQSCFYCLFCLFMLWDICILSD